MSVVYTRKYADPIKVRLSADQLDRLARLSEDTGITVTELIRSCVTQALPYVENAVRAAAREKS